MDNTLSGHRNYLLRTIDGLLEGNVPVNVASAVAEVSEQYFRSVQQEWNMRVYTVENNIVDNRTIDAVLEHKSEDD